MRPVLLSSTAPPPTHTPCRLSWCRYLCGAPPAPDSMTSVPVLFDGAAAAATATCVHTAAPSFASLSQTAAPSFASLPSEMYKIKKCAAAVVERHGDPNIWLAFAKGCERRKSHPRTSVPRARSRRCNATGRHDTASCGALKVGALQK